MSNTIRFKAKCQGEFDELLPQAYALIEEATGEKCDTKIKLRFADIGKKAGLYGQYVKKGRSYHFCLNVTLNAQLIDHPDESQPTIAHELAHFVVDQIKKHKSITDRRGKWGVHGSEWKKAAISLGDNGDRCHQLSFDTARFKARLTRNDDAHYSYSLSAKNAKTWLNDPKVEGVEVKDAEGFWIPAGGAA